jgi:HAD superfamily hydrolase (TIGR01484 family)
MPDKTDNREKSILWIIALLGALVGVLGALAAEHLQGTSQHIVEVFTIFLAGLGIGGLPVQMIIESLQRRERRKTGEDLRRIFERSVKQDPTNPKDEKQLPRLFAMDVEGCITPKLRSPIELAKFQRLRAYCDYARTNNYPPIVFFTGRSQGYVELLAQSLGIVKDDRDLPVAIECGTALYYPHSKTTERLHPAGKDAAYRQLNRDIEELLRSKLPDHEFEPKCYMVTINPESPNETTDDLLPKVYRIIEDAGYGTDPSTVAALGNVKITSSATAVDITPAGLSKLSALIEIAKKATAKGIVQQDLGGTVALGDHLSDIEVLKAAGRAYCPADAHDDVKKAVQGRDNGSVLNENDIDFVIRVIEMECGLSISDPSASRR